MTYTDYNKYFDVIYPCIVRNTSGLKKTVQISKPQHPVAANGKEMVGLFSYDLFATLETKNGNLSIYFGGKGSPPEGKPIPSFVEFKKVYNTPEELQNDQDKIQSISQNKKGFQFEVQQIENGWSFKLDRLDQKINDRDLKLAENLTDFISKTFR
jgi:hypothetical protein